MQQKEINRKEQQLLLQQGQINSLGNFESLNGIRSIEPSIILFTPNSSAFNGSQSPKQVQYGVSGNPNNFITSTIENSGLRRIKTESSVNDDMNQFQQQKQEFQRNQTQHQQNPVERYSSGYPVQNLQQFPQTYGNQQMKNSVYTNANNKVIAITNNTKYAINLVALYLEKINISNYELLTVPGGIFGLQNNQFWENYVLKSIEIMNLKEVPKTIFLISALSDYSNNKMYGQSNDIEDQRRIANSIRMKLQMNLIATPIFHGILLKDRTGQYERLF